MKTVQQNTRIANAEVLVPRKTLLLFMLLVFLTTLLFASRVIQLRDKDNGRTIPLKKGDNLALVLKSNPSTGYEWEIVELDERIVEPVGKPAFRPDNDAPGSGGVTLFHFHAVNAGLTPLKLIYHRPFEKDQPPTGTFQVMVRVGE